jgi:acyl transferase domain-containing protein/NADPH:quinone reductase-like Zn-dependent oxidoreductase/surfactin synthase thioesterase subunit
MSALPTSLPRDPLAVIGIGCRLPGNINTPTELWAALLEGRDGIRPVPADRWDNSFYYDPDKEKRGKTKNDRGGFLEAVDLFDAAFFGYFPAEANRIDPQQRLLLEVAHEAIEDAGIPAEQLSGSRTSVFIGSFMYDYLCQQTGSEAGENINPYVAMGTGLTSLANRISYVFNLKGPSVSLDTACSSSLVALHLACRSIWNGEAEMGIAGGVNLILRPESTILLSKAGFLNTDGYCKAFDASANGYVRAEGSGVVVLKPLSKALADGDRVYGVIRGTAVNQDGYVAEGFTVPSADAQISVLLSAYRDAGVEPGTVQYVEAHGPGTAVGDPIECKALGTIIGQARGEGSCLVGSVKTNVGHLEGASGITGFLKGLLVARHGTVPPNLHFLTPNPAIDFAGLNLQVADRRYDLNRESAVRVGVNSFGAGGTNAHVVIEGVPEAPASPAPPLAAPRPFLLSAKSREALGKLAADHAERLAADTDLASLGQALIARRSRYPHTLVASARDVAELRSQWQSFVAGEKNRYVTTSVANWKPAPKVAFMFSGQGGQWPGMGLKLYEAEPVFRAVMDEIDALFAVHAGWSILEHIRAEAATSELNRTVVVQPAIMSIQVALARLLMHYGVLPAGIVGHSIGEVAAAHIAGAISLRDAVAVIYQRSRIQSKAAGKGRMLAVGASEAEAAVLLKGNEERASIATINGPRTLTLAGDAPVLEKIAAELEARGVFNRFVNVEVPYHSHHMEPLYDEMLLSLGDVCGSLAPIPLYSTVSTQREPGTHLGGRYWYDNVREPVRMTGALRTMVADGYDVFVEIGPHPVLVSGAGELFQELGAKATAFLAMHAKQPEFAALNGALGQLVANGVKLDLTKLFPEARPFVDLPKHPWMKERYWSESAEAKQRRLHPIRNPFLKAETRLVSEDSARIWSTRIGTGTFPFVKDHQVDGECVFPGTGHLETAWAVGREAFPGSEISLSDVRFDAALILPEETATPLEIRLEIASNEGDYRICSRPQEADSETPWTRHSSGRINFLPGPVPACADGLADVEARFNGAAEADVEAFYATIRQAGLDYGPKFQGVRRLWQQGAEIFAEVALPEELHYEQERFHAHPALLDACLHTVFLDVHRNSDPSRVYLPYSIDCVKFHRHLPSQVRSLVRVSRNDAQFLIYDLFVFTVEGDLAAQVNGITCKIIGGAKGQNEERLYEGCYEYQWVPEAAPRAGHQPLHDLKEFVLVAPAATGLEPLAAALAAGGRKVRLLDDYGLFSPDGRARMAEALSAGIDRRTHVVYYCAPELGASLEEWPEIAGIPAHAQGLLNLTQALIDNQVYPRFSLVTCGAAGTGPEDTSVRLGQSALFGVMRVFKNECPNVPSRVIDLPASPLAEAFADLAAELTTARLDLDEFEVALRPGRRLLRTLTPVYAETAEAAGAVELPGTGGAWRAGLAETGSLDSVEFRQVPAPAPGEGELEIEVLAAALNFKDIVNGMGVLPKKAVAGGLAADQLGLEICGRVLRVGGTASAFRVGDRVMARVSGGFSGRLLAREDCVAPTAERLTAQQAAAIPVVYLTAYYGLHHLGRMQAGDTVLIHSAAGGVGMAAIRLAQRAGANLIATAGTKEKRQALRDLGIAHVFDSRSLDFHTQVMEVTAGQGVDIVLNSLTGNFITQSVKSLAPFGRFIEIGKADIYKNAKLSLERLGENISFHVVDVDRMATQKPALHRQLLNEVAGLFADAEFPAPDVTEFPVTRLADAFKHMSRAAYVGKIVVTMEGQTVQALPAKQTPAPDGSVFVSGGCGGFGLEIAKWFAAAGVKHLVLAGRSGVKNEADQAAIAALEAAGTTVVIERLDVGEAAAVRAVFARFGREWPALGGVVHAAGLLRDASLLNMDAAQFREVFVPKAIGGWNLHQAVVTGGHSPAVFMNLSSISSVLGLFGQSNYCAANYVLDALAEWRQQQGLPATSLNLGVLGDYAGMSRQENDAADVLALLDSHGMPSMPLADVLGKLNLALCQRPAQRMTARFDWIRFTTVYPHLQRDQRFAECIGESRKRLTQGGRSGGGLAAQLARAEGGAQRELLAAELAKALAKILDITPAKIDAGASIDKLSLDSLMLNQLRNWILRNLSINLPLIKLLKGPSLDELSAMLLQQFGGGAVKTGGATSETSPASASFALLEDSNMTAVSPWLIRGNSDPDANVRLFCFHSMGVGASLYTRFLMDPPAGYDIFAIQTPGRENRAHEPALDTVDGLVAEIVRELTPWLDKPFVVWGHSFGGIVAYEVLKQLRREQKQAPLSLLITGTVAPELIRIWQHREVMLKALVAENNAEYLLSLSRYVEDAEFIRSILPIMRKDTPLLMNYRYQPEERFHFPILAFGARQDDMVYLDEISPWANQTTARFELREVAGDHWFLNKNRLEIVAQLEQMRLPAWYLSHLTNPPPVSEILSPLAPAEETSQPEMLVER